MSRDILTLAGPRAERHIAYGPNRHQFGELRRPPGPGPHPVAIVVHGGCYGAAYSLRHIGHFCAALAAAGVATWSLEYRRLGQRGGGWPGTLADVACGADHLRALAPMYRLDLARVMAAGHSAGGHLALWLAARHRLTADTELYTPDPLRLCGVVPLAGLVDLAQCAEQGVCGDAVPRLLGGPLEAVPARYAVASPPALLPLGLPQILVHGAADPIVPLAISASYVAAAQAAGDPTRLLPIPDAGHFELIDPRAAAWPVVADAILSLLEDRSPGPA